MTSDVLLRDVTERDLPIFFEQQLDPAAIIRESKRPRCQDVFITSPHLNIVVRHEPAPRRFPTCDSSLGHHYCAAQRHAHLPRRLVRR